MWYSKSYRYGIGFGKVGVIRNPEKEFKVWKPGLRVFTSNNEGVITFRINYLRINKKQYYFEFFFPYKKSIGECSCKEIK